MYIYKTTNIINGKIYIGLSTSTVDESTNYYGSGKILHRAISKYGKENFTKEILESNIESKEILNQREIYYISKYNSTDDSIGYNITYGGTGGDTISNHPDRDVILSKISNASKKLWQDPEYKAKMSIKQKEIWSDPEYKAMMSEIFKGHPPYPNQQRAAAISSANRVWTEESKDKLRKAKLGKKFSKEVNRKKRRPGSKWYYNPETDEARMFHDAPPSPWVIGRRPGFIITRPENHSSTRDTKMYYNPENNRVRYLHEDDEVPTGFIKGNPRKGKEGNTKGSKWYHNPETGESRMLKEAPHEGWLRGRGKCTSEETKSKIRAASKKGTYGQTSTKSYMPTL